MKRYHSVLSIAGALLIPVLWWSLKRFFPIPDRYLPSLSAVVAALRDIEPSMWSHTAATVTRLILGFVGGTVTGVLIGVSFAQFPRLDAFCSPIVHSLRAIPAAATVPFFLMWFGFAEVGRYLIVFLAVGLNVAVAAREILSRHSSAHLAFFASFGLRLGSLPFRYSLPRIGEELLPTLRYSLSVAIGAVAVSEMLGSQVGLGYLLQTGRSTFSLQLMFLAMIAFGLVASLMDFVLRLVWIQLVYWKHYEK